MVVSTAAKFDVVEVSMMYVTVRVSGAIVALRAGTISSASMVSGLYPSAPRSMTADCVLPAPLLSAKVLMYVASLRLRGIICFFECFWLDYATTASVFVIESVTLIGTPLDSTGVVAVMIGPA